MIPIFNKNLEKYNDEQKEWIKSFDKNLSQLKTQTLINPMKENIKEDIRFSAIKNSISNKMDGDKKNQFIDFFKHEYLTNIVDFVHSLINKKPNDVNHGVLFPITSQTNKELLNKSVGAINDLYDKFNDPESINKVLKGASFAKKITEISLDINLSPFTSTLIKHGLNYLADNSLLNRSIKAGNLDLFKTVLNNFSGKKQDFDKNSDSPFFWQPFIFVPEREKIMDEMFSLLKNNGFEFDKEIASKLIKDKDNRFIDKDKEKVINELDLPKQRKLI